MTHSITGWIDIPVEQAIEYFSGVLATFYKWGLHYAFFIGTIGLCWSAFKLINSRFTVRDFWWDTFYKWLLFILFMSIYPAVSIGLSAIGNRVGIEAGGGKKAIIDSLTSMKQSLEKDLAVQEQWSESLESELKSRFEDFTFDTTFGNSENYNAYIDSLSMEINAARFKSKDAKKNAQELVNEYREKNKYHSLYGARTLKAIKDILIEKLPDGTDGDALTNSYVDLNIWLKNSDESDSYYLSPAAILRVSILGCQILWEKNQIAYALDLDEIEDQDINFMKKGFSKMSATMAHVPTMIMTLLCCLILIACTIFALIQYVMTILEYTIIMGIGAFFIPFILFDGTKELPKKLVPVFTGFLIKMIVMNICMFFVFYLFIQQTVDVMADNGGMNWVSFSTIAFTSIIALVLTQNAPKIAMTLLTGQPQLSMGEFVQAVGSVAVGARLGSRVAKGTAHVAKEGTRSAAQGVINTGGSIAKTRAAGQAARQVIKEHGGTDKQANEATRKGMYASVSEGLRDRFRNAGNNFLHGGSKGGHGGSSGSGNQAFQRSGQNTSRELGPEDSRTLNNTSNPKFQSATKFDPATGGLINMSHSEWKEEKQSQGKSQGEQAALAMLAAEEKTQTPKKDSSLPENLTGNERAMK